LAAPQYQRHKQDSSRRKRIGSNIQVFVTNYVFASLNKQIEWAGIQNVNTGLHRIESVRDVTTLVLLMKPKSRISARAKLLSKR